MYTQVQGELLSHIIAIPHNVLFGLSYRVIPPHWSRYPTHPEINCHPERNEVEQQ